MADSWSLFSNIPSFGISHRVLGVTVELASVLAMGKYKSGQCYDHPEKKQNRTRLVSEAKHENHPRDDLIKCRVGC